MSFIDYLQNCAMGVVGGIAVGVALKWSYKSGVDLITNWVMKELMIGLRGDSVKDPDIRAFVHDITLAFVRLAEKKLPDTGMGPERKLWVVTQLTSKLPIFKGREKELGDIIDKMVATLDSEFKVILSPQKTN